MNKEETDLIIAKQNKSTEEILNAIEKVKQNIQKRCELKDKQMDKDNLKSVASTLAYQRTMERPKTYEEGIRDGFLKGQEEVNKVLEQMLYTTCNPVVCELPETEAVKLLQKENTELRRNLTEAKELIGAFVFLVTHPRTALDTKTYLMKAEQFIVKETENESRRNFNRRR